MKILQVHNFYQQPGGEDQVFRSERDLLVAHGHQVVQLTRHNDGINGMSRLRVAAATIWNRSIYREVRRLIKQEKPTLAHFHNTFPLISPAAFHAAQAERVPVVLTLHNYRLICPNGLLFRDGSVCEDCMGHSVPWPGVVHGCYRDSRAATGVTAVMLAWHRLLRTWHDRVSVYVCMTEFARRKFAEAGLPAHKIVVKPHFVQDPGTGNGSGGYALFVGRLSPEKGVATLLKAWKLLGGRIPLKIVGDGPLVDVATESVRALPGVEMLGHLPPQQVLALMGRAVCLIVPSESYETFGRVVVEAFAVGTPVIAADLGAVAELVEDGRTGVRFRPGDAVDLAAKVDHLLSAQTTLVSMRREARDTYEKRYTPEVSYHMMLGIYARAREGVSDCGGATESHTDPGHAGRSD